MKISELIKAVRNAKKVLFYVNGHGGLHVVAVKSDYLNSLKHIQKLHGKDHEMQASFNTSEGGWIYITGE